MERVKGYQGSEISSSVAVILWELTPNLAFKHVLKNSCSEKGRKILRKQLRWKPFIQKLVGPVAIISL